MKKSLLIPIAGVLVVAAAGGGYAYMALHRDHLRRGETALAAGDLRTAQLELRTAVRDDPDRAEAHYQLGLVQERLGDVVAAEKEFRASLDRGYDKSAAVPRLMQTYVDQQHDKELLVDFPVPSGPLDLAARVAIARATAQLRLTQTEAAEASLAAARKLAPTMPEIAFVAAQLDMARNDPKAAEAELDTVLRQTPANAQALMMKSAIQGGRGDRDGALATIGAAIDAAPKLSAARVARADMLLNRGDDEKAKADVDAAIAADPRNGFALYLKAVLLTRARDFKAADDLFARLAPLLPRLPRGYFFAGVAKSGLSQWEQAADFAGRYHARVPNDPDGTRLVARVALANQRPEEAVAVLNQAVSAGQADTDMLDMLGRAYAATGRPNQALQTLARASELAPNNSALLTRLASTKLGLGDAGGAASDLQRSFDLAPDSPAAGPALILAALASGDTQKAASALDTLRKRDGETDMVGNLDGMIKLARLDFAGARTQFEAVLRAHPDFVPAMLNLAKLDALEGRPQDAEKVFGDILQKQPDNEAALAGLVPILVQSNRTGRAIQVIEAARAAAPKNVAFTSALADLEMRAGDAEKALSLLDGVPADQSGQPAILGARARALVALKKAPEASEVYRRILAANPADLDARARLVELLLQAKDVDGAKGVIADGLKATPTNYPMMQTLVRLEMQQHGLDAALSTADKLSATPGAPPDAQLLKGDLYVGLRQFDKAADAFGSVLRSKPQSAAALRLAAVQNSLERRDDAIQTLSDWTAKNPDDVAALDALGTMQLQANRYEAAGRSFEKVTAQRTTDAGALNNLAIVYQQAKDPRAYEMARRAYLLAPSPEIGDTLGWILVTDGRAAAGLPLLKVASERLPGNPEILYHYGAALNATGQKAEAGQVIGRAIASTERFPERDAARALLGTINAAK